METLELQAEKRTEMGSAPSRRLRRSGRLPVNLYGQGSDPLALHIDAHTLEQALRHHARVASLKFDGGAADAVIHKVDHDPISQEVLHVDFLRVDLSKKVEVAVPLKLHGPAQGEVDGGILQEQNDSITVSVLPLQIPEEIEVDIRELKIHESIHVRDVVLPEGMEAVDDGDKVLLSIAEPRYGVDEAAAGEEGEGGAEPEVIGKADKDGEDKAD